MSEELGCARGLFCLWREVLATLWIGPIAVLSIGDVRPKAIELDNPAGLIPTVASFVLRSFLASMVPSAGRVERMISTTRTAQTASFMLHCTVIRQVLPLSSQSTQVSLALWEATRA